MAKGIAGILCILCLLCGCRSTLRPGTEEIIIGTVIDRAMSRTNSGDFSPVRPYITIETEERERMLWLPRGEDFSGVTVGAYVRCTVGLEDETGVPLVWEIVVITEEERAA